MLLPRPIVHTLLLLACTVSTVRAVDLEEMPEYRAVREALLDGLPAVAALKATRLMESAAPRSTERQTLASLAVEAWVRASDGRAALKILQSEKVPNADFWIAQAQVQAGELDAAEKLLIGRVRENSATSQERFLLAQVSLATGNLAQAREILEPLRESHDKIILMRARRMWDEVELRAGRVEQALADLTHPSQPLDDKARLLLAQGLVEAGRQSEAQTQLRELVSGTQGGERVHHAASILLADSFLRENNRAQAVEVLVQFLENTAESELWTSAFDLLARCLSEKGTLLPPDATLRWLAEGNAAQRAALTAPATTSLFQGHAMLLLARWLAAQERNFEALGLLEAQLQIHAGHPQSEEAMQLALETYSAGKADARVAALTEMWRRRFGANGSSMVEFVTAGTAYTRGDYPRAAELFQTAANLATTLAERRSALYNAGVSALRAGEIALYQSLLAQLQIVSGDASADLELDRALELAAKATNEAETELRGFIQRHAQHARLFDAHLALAEVLLMRVPTDFAEVDRALKAAESLPTITDRQRERALLTKLWRLDRQGQLKELTEAGTAFLKAWPETSQAALVRMKVADAYFRLENFAAARTEFELVAKETAASPYADTALYFAGMSALSMMSDEGRETAISLWQELAERGGPLSIPARQQQAMAKRRAGQEAEALTLLDSLLTEKNLSKELRRSLTCEKVEILMVLGKADVASLTSAITVLQAFLREDDLTFQWRARGGYTLAVALHSAGRDAEALEASYDVVQATGFTGPSDPAEFRWYYRAGFFGIDLLEGGKQWEAAARLAEKLATTSGDRALEAKERATKIRLEHFLWDGK
jgi:TolA-binding protein